MVKIKRAPTYTLTFWPEGIDETQAERNELLVHVHFDAKYRVENIESLFGAESSDDADDETDGNYKRQDLLKMHAYRDAIKRSQGAYVLYPGRASQPVRFEGFHEILPGLGAFGVSPDESGRAHGMEQLSKFLDETLTHLCDRTTAYERGSFHIQEAYRTKNAPRVSAGLLLPEFDIFGDGYRALPPAEHMVMVAWRCEADQISWMRANATGVVRLGRLSGGWRIQSEWAGLRHLLLRGAGEPAVQGLWRLTKPGYRVMTDANLVTLGYPVALSGDLYAVFDVDVQQDMVSATWELKALVRAVRDFERSKHHLMERPSGRQSMLPRILSLADLIKALPDS